jgi:hypothetical protein
MSRIDDLTGSRIARHLALRPNRYPFLDVDPLLLGDRDIEGMVVAEAVDRALAGEDRSPVHAAAYLETRHDVPMEIDSFRILSMSDVHPLVAVALALAYNEDSDDHSIRFLVDLDLPGRRIAEVHHVRTPGSQIDLDYDLSNTLRWTSWQRGVRYVGPEDDHGIRKGHRLSDVARHRATEGLDLAIKEVRSEDAYLTGCDRWVKASDLPLLHARLQSEGCTRVPARPPLRHAQALGPRILALVEQAEDHAIRLRMAATRLGFR